MFMIHLLAGAAGGVLTGFGVGGGTLLMIYMTVLAHMSQSAARGINLMYFLPTAGASIIGHIRARLIVRSAFVPSACAGVLCAAGAAFLANLIDPAPARKLFGVFLIVTGATELLRKSKK